jgi:prevent-host-death family protein
MVMVTVTTAELKARLSKYLRLVRAGEIVQVTSHRHPVAHVIPHPGHQQVLFDSPTRPISDLKEVRGVDPLKAIEVSDVLVDDRQRR